MYEAVDVGSGCDAHREGGTYSVNAKTTRRTLRAYLIDLNGHYAEILYYLWQRFALASSVLRQVAKTGGWAVQILKLRDSDRSSARDPLNKYKHQKI